MSSDIIWRNNFSSFDSSGAWFRSMHEKHAEAAWGSGVISAFAWKQEKRSQSQSYVTTDGQLASLSWCQAPIWGPDSCGFLLMLDALSDERMGLSFTIAAVPRQRNHSRVLVPRDSWPYFTLSDSRLPQPGGPGPRIYICQEQGGPVYPQALGSLSVASYDSQGYGGGIRTHSRWD
jgi:hypothetical protein